MDEEDLVDDKGRPLVFYYSRENRLKKASQTVRDFNASSPQRGGIFRTLTATKPLTILFISIVLLCIMTVIYSRFSAGKTLGNNTVTVTALAGENKSFITVTKTANPDAYTGAVDLAVSPAKTPPSRNAKKETPAEPDESPIHTERLYFSPEKEDVFRFTAPFPGKKFLVLMEAKEERILFTVFPK